VLQPSGVTVEVLVAIRAAGGLLLFSDETFAELSTRMMRAKLDRYAEPAERQQFLSEIAAVG
jgi:predicted nucleic acid-binding protein